MIYVLYHANCYDGFGAAWAAWTVFKGEAEYRPVYAVQIARLAVVPGQHEEWTRRLLAARTREA